VLLGVCTVIAYLLRARSPPLIGLIALVGC
jgi:hypothetical protein